MSTSPSFTASKVPGGAEGCLGSIWILMRPLVAFSTFSPQTTTTFLVRGWVGDTQLDMVSVVWAVAEIGSPASEATAKAAKPPRRAVVRRNIVESPPGRLVAPHPA